MAYEAFGGIFSVLIAGILQGMYAVPMKWAKEWEYENIWLTFTALALFILPWLLTAGTIQNPWAIYSATPKGTMVAIGGFGVLWGIGVVFTGLGLSMLGIGLSFAIILGLSASVGSLIPLAVFQPDKIWSHQGHIYLLGTVIMLVGIACMARSGYLRDQQDSAAEERMGRSNKGGFITGLVVVIAAGVLSSSLNLCYAFGSPALDAARRYGASQLWSSNVVTAIAMTGGFIANLAYCGYLLWRRRTAVLFRLGRLQVNWLWCTIMALFWFGGQVFYGYGFSRTGELGAVLSWPLLMGMIIITSTAAGWWTGEWKGARVETRAYLGFSIALVLVSLGVLALGRGA